MDEERHSGNYWWCDLAILQEDTLDCEFGESSFRCREEYGGEHLIIIDPV